MRTTVTSLLGSLLLATLAALALPGACRAQEEGQDPGPGAGRKRFQREQGKEADLQAQLQALMTALGGAEPGPAAEAFQALAPDEKVLEDVLTEEGRKVLGARLLEASAGLFGGTPSEIAQRLGLDPSQTEVTVFAATTEDLVSMEFGTVAAQEFASALRRTARLLQPRYRWYAAVLRKPGEEEGGARLQLFVFSGGRYVLLGRVWRLDGEEGEQR